MFSICCKWRRRQQRWRWAPALGGWRLGVSPWELLSVHTHVHTHKYTHTQNQKHTKLKCIWNIVTKMYSIPQRLAMNHKTFPWSKKEMRLESGYIPSSSRRQCGASKKVAELSSRTASETLYEWFCPKPLSNSYKTNIFSFFSIVLCCNLSDLTKLWSKSVPACIFDDNFSPQWVWEW